MTAPAEPALARAMNLPAYLARIRYEGPLAPTAETLAALHRAQLYSVPFENLDIGLGRPLSLALPALFDKIVTRRRGGFCYELNGLFGWLLQSLGYSVTYLSARVYGGDGGLGPEFDHLTLLVQPPGGERWLADVGFGDSYVEPLRLEAGLEQAQGRRTFGLVEQGSAWDYWLREAGGAVERQHAFTLQPRQFPADFEAMCVVQQTDPNSHFVQHRLCTLATPEGRKTLSDLRWIVTRDGERSERAIEEVECPAILAREFGIVLTA
jgi:N-hydroxyarylamine O-acetyltransferase